MILFLYQIFSWEFYSRIWNCRSCRRMRSESSGSFPRTGAIRSHPSAGSMILASSTDKDHALKGPRRRARSGPAPRPTTRRWNARDESFSRTDFTLLSIDAATTSLLLPPPNRFCPFCSSRPLFFRTHETPTRFVPSRLLSSRLSPVAADNFVPRLFAPHHILHFNSLIPREGTNQTLFRIYLFSFFNFSIFPSFSRVFQLSTTTLVQLTLRRVYFYSAELSVICCA